MRRALPLLCLIAAACGPIEYIANTPLEAAGAVAEAKAMKGDKYAPYETTAAQEYLHKSRELAGHARFEDSVDFARKATKYAKEAQRLANEKASQPQTEPSPTGAP